MRQEYFRIALFPRWRKAIFLYRFQTIALYDILMTHMEISSAKISVFIPKYRRKMLFGTNKKDLTQIIPKLCEMKGVEIIEGKVCKDHIHMYVAIPPKLSVSEFMSYLKGKSALMFFDRHPEIGAKWGEKHLWARGYYVSTVGNVNEETIREYIREQEENDKMGDRAIAPNGGDWYKKWYCEAPPLAEQVQYRGAVTIKPPFEMEVALKILPLVLYSRQIRK